MSLARSSTMTLLSPNCRCLLLIVAFLETVCTRVGITQGQDQAFLHSEGELRYLVDGSSMTVKQGHQSKDASERHHNHPSEEVSVLGSPIEFEPNELDFREQPLGLPILRKVRVKNLNRENSIQMLSISGNTIHFHCSFFADKVIPPSGNTTFDVVFLGREEGPVENILYVHTSAGSFRFKVQAQGVPNPYRIKPLVGVRIPMNSSYAPLIDLHNPNPDPIQVLEMYSSGGDLHLELPSGETEGPQGLWSIPPFQTKSVMKARFVARTENNHTAYIRIKTNVSGAEFLYVPMEVEVSSQPGLYSPHEVIDFGLLSSEGKPKTVQIYVLNSGSKSISIQNVITTPVTEALSIDFQPKKIAPDTYKPMAIAEVTFNPSLVNEDGPLSGKIVIKSRNSQYKVTVPYRAKVIQGGLRVNGSGLFYHLKGEKPDEDYKKKQADVTVTNDLKMPVVVHKISVPKKAEKFFEFSFEREEDEFEPVVIKPGEVQTLMRLDLKPEAWEERILNSNIILHTNLSDVDVPLICFHGLLKTFLPGSPSQDLLDFGTLGMSEKRDLFFAVLNPNPVGVTLKGWGSNLTGSLVELMGVEEGGENEILQRQNFSTMTRRLNIPPNHYMVFRVGILTNNDEGETEGNVFVDTDHHKFEVKFRFKVARGSLHTVPRELVFHPAFPGKTVSLKLKVFSSFAQEMKIANISPIPPDPRFTFIADPKNDMLLSGQKTFLGKVIFDPGARCAQEETCYTGFPTTGKVGRGWLSGLVLPVGIADSDVALTHTLYNRLLDDVHPSASFNITLNLDTDQVRGFHFKARATLSWPRVIKDDSDVVEFPLTQTGNFSYEDFILNNPSDSPIYVHLVPANVYPDALKAVNLLPTRGRDLNLTSTKVSLFKIISVTDMTTSDPVASFIEDMGLTQLNPETKAFILKPGHSAKIKVMFRPQNGYVPKSKSSDLYFIYSALFVRNNLTGVELIELTGTAVQASLSFGGWKTEEAWTDGSALLAFDVGEKLANECKQESRRQKTSSPPPLGVRKNIRLKNTGLVPFHVSRFDIEGQPCTDGGFTVLNCDPLTLDPEEYKDIIVAFTPDFSSSVVSKKLSIRSSLGAPHKVLNFTLEATLSAAVIAECSDILPRPTWETYLFYCVNVSLVFACACILAVIYYETDKKAKEKNVLPDSLVSKKPNETSNSCRNSMSNLTTLDLRSIPEQVSNELRHRKSTDSPSAVPSTQTTSKPKGNNPTKALPNQEIPSWIKPRSGAPGSPRTYRRSTQHHHQQSNVLNLFARKIRALWSLIIAVVWKTWDGFKDALSFPSVFRSRNKPIVVKDNKTTDGAVINGNVSSGQQIKKTNPAAAVKASAPSSANNSRICTPVNQSRKNKKKGGKTKFQHIHQQHNVISSSKSGLVDEEMETSSTTTESSNMDEEHATKANNNKHVTNDLSYSNNSSTERQQQQQQQTSIGFKKKSKSSKATNVRKGDSFKDTNESEETKPNGNNLKEKSPKAKQAQPKSQPEKSKHNDTQNKNQNKDSKKKEAKCSAKHDSHGTSVSSTQTVKCTMVGQLNSTQPPFSSAPAQQKQKAKVTPVGKILPEPKKPENIGAQYGPIGMPTTPRSMFPRQSTWSNSPAEAKPFVNPPLLGTSAETASKHLENVHQETPAALQQSSPSRGMLSRSSSSPYHRQQTQETRQDVNNFMLSGDSSPTLMQSLIRERKQRYQDYLRQTTDWPGFTDSKRSFIEELWDNQPMGQLSQTPGQTWGSWATSDPWGRDVNRPVGMNNPSSLLNTTGSSVAPVGHPVSSESVLNRRDIVPSTLMNSANENGFAVPPTTAMNNTAWTGNPNQRNFDLSDPILLRHYQMRQQELQLQNELRFLRAASSQSSTNAPWNKTAPYRQ